MRDYLSPARKMVERVIPHPAAVRAFVIKRRALVFAMTATSILALALSVMTVRAINGSSDSKHTTVTAEGKTSTLSTAATETKNNEEQQSVNEQSSSQKSTSDSGSSSESKTTVTINNEDVPLPDNGSVQRTITNDDGSTHINVTTNSDSAGNSYSSSFVTNTANSNSMNMNTSITSNSQNVTITTQ